MVQGDRHEYREALVSFNLVVLSSSFFGKYLVYCINAVPSRMFDQQRLVTLHVGVSTLQQT